MQILFVFPSSDAPEADAYGRKRGGKWKRSFYFLRVPRLNRQDGRELVYVLNERRV